MKKIILSNELLLPSAVDFLSKGKRVIIPIKGYSMHPFIVAGRDCVELYPPQTILEGDIVLAQINNQFILHRVIKIEAEGQVTLKGDGNLYQKERCHITDIKGIARFSIRDNDKRHSLDSRYQKLKAKLWFLQPIIIRRIILRIFHIIHKNTL